MKEPTYSMKTATFGGVMLQLVWHSSDSFFEFEDKLEMLLIVQLQADRCLLRLPA
jgi:hypothetical protein